MRKKTFVFSLLFLVMPLVSAAGPLDGLRTALSWLREMADILLNFTSNILFDSPFHGEAIYIKMLMFFVLLIVINITLRRNNLFSEYKSLNFVIALAVSILSVRYLPEDLFGGIIIPYGALAVSIFVFLPFIIFFSFIHNTMSSFGRRASIVVYAAAFIYLWQTDPGRIGLTETIYWVGLGLILLAFIFDTQVHNWLSDSASRKAKKSRIERLEEKIMFDIDKIEELMYRGRISEKEGKRRINHLNNRLKNLRKS